jgi:hypothetical protein
MHLPANFDRNPSACNESPMPPPNGLFVINDVLVKAFVNASIYDVVVIDRIDTFANPLYDVHKLLLGIRIFWSLRHFYPLSSAKIVYLALLMGFVCRDATKVAILDASTSN